MRVCCSLGVWDPLGFRVQCGLEGIGHEGVLFSSLQLCCCLHPNLNPKPCTSTLLASLDVLAAPLSHVGVVGSHVLPIVLPGAVGFAGLGAKDG